MTGKSVGIAQPFRPASPAWMVMSPSDARELRAQSFAQKARRAIAETAGEA